MTNPPRLTQALRRQADSMPSSRPLELSDVKNRARGIRRRRYAVTGLAAAAVLAVAVPAGLAVTDRVDRTGGGFADQTQSARPTPTPTASPTHTPSKSASPPRTASVPSVLLTTNIEQGSGEPAVPYVFDGNINRPDGSVVPVADYDGVAPLGDRWVVTGDAGSGQRFTALLDANGHETARYPGAGVLAVSPDGSLVSYATATQLRVVWDGGSTTLPTRPGASQVTPVAVQGSAPCDGAKGSGCVVYYNVDGQTPAAYSSSSQGTARTPFVRIDDVSTDGRLAGQTTLDDGSAGSACWAVNDPQGARSWSTCDYELGRFSPDGRFLLGYAPQGDGRGETSVTVLDAADGTPLVTYAPRRGADVFLHEAVWDTNGTVLATVWDIDHWALMRMTPDGQLSSVSKGGLANGLDPDSVPLHLAARP